jgi:hypothetical protein
MSDIIQRIEDLEKSISKWNKRLDKEGFWLLIATLAVWSVKPLWLQMSAMVLVLFAFAIRAEKKIGKKHRFNFKERAEALRKESSPNFINKSIYLRLIAPYFSYFSALRHCRIATLAFFFWIVNLIAIPIYSNGNRGDTQHHVETSEAEQVAAGNPPG